MVCAEDSNKVVVYRTMMNVKKAKNDENKVEMK